MTGLRIKDHHSDVLAGVALVSNALSGPADEGTRKFAEMIASAVERSGGHVVPIDPGSPSLETKLLMPRTVADLRRSGKPRIIYIPTQSITRGSLIRCALLKGTGASQIVLIATQPRDPIRAPAHVLARFGPELVLSPSPSVTRAATRLKLRSATIPMGVDLDRFTPRNQSRHELRARFGLPDDKPVIVHVGHARSARNLGWLLALSRSVDATILAVLGSARGHDESIVHSLRMGGIKVLNEYVSDIADVYRAADLYVFPVVDEGGAIGVPLSVLEAMACGLPVVTTPFGGLPEMFEPGDGLSFAASRDEWVGLARAALGTPTNNRNRTRVEAYGWDATIRNVVDAIVAR